MIWLLSTALIVGAFLLGCAAGWLLRGGRDRRRAWRQADQILRLAREEDAAFERAFGPRHWNLVRLRPRSDRGLLGLDVPRGAA